VAVAKQKIFIGVVLCIAALAIVGYRHWTASSMVDTSLQEIANADAQFWLMQGKPNNRFIPCAVYYHFDTPLDETLVRARLSDLVASYPMFQRNVVEVDGLPYWQPVKPDWNKNFRVLEAGEDIESLRVKTDTQISTASGLGEGLPLFRAYLSADHRQLIFIWHHVISDFEGMFNKHAKHLFMEKGERTRFGYQLGNDRTDAKGRVVSSSEGLVPSAITADRPLGFTATDFKVVKVVLPVEDQQLYAMGMQAGLPMSDIFSLITLRAVTRYEEESNGDDRMASIRPLVSPISLRKNSLATDEGNNRAVRQFPFVFPLESMVDMYQRVIKIDPTSGSYDTTGRVMRIARQFPVLEPSLRRMAMPDYISNYFPLADIPLALGDAKLLRHDLRVPMVPYERTKFAWSNYNGEVQLYLHIDPLLIDEKRMLDAFSIASGEILYFLSEYRFEGKE
jgi:Tfp pilus assembly major pilin PilA